MAFSKKLSEKDSPESLRLSHLLLKNVPYAIETMQFNTAIAHMMEFINDFTKLDSYPREAVKIATQLLYPFAPHICEEIWEHLQEKEALTFAPLPKVNESYIQEKTATYVIQINGKFRGKWDLKKDISEKELLEFAKNQEKIAKYLTGKILKSIFVPNKLLNIVVE
jgi:leucyl-tRNA synthetase